VNVNDYIASGTLEAYALGALPEEERAEVEALIARHPELAEELAAIEESLIQMAEANAVQPPPGLEDKIWAAIQLDNSHQAPSTHTIPLPPPSSSTTSDKQSGSDGTSAKVIPLGGNAGNSWQRAALWVALALSVGGNAMLWQSRNAASQQAEGLAQQLSTLQQERGIMQQQLVTFQEERTMMTDPGMKRVLMTSPDASKEMRGALFIAPNGHEAYLALAKMPPPPPGKQYQLWVLKGGKPVDMGVIPNSLVEGGAEKMTMPIEGGEAFAISLEKAGGSPVPTMEQIQVLGKV
jgi:hypothetical protein